MRLLDRYLLRELLIPLGYCLGGFLIFWVAFDLFSELNRLQEQNLGVADVAALYLVRIPEFLVLVLPMALLLALLYSLTNHARHNELTAMRAAGVTWWRICLPYMITGLVLSLTLFGLNEFWVPYSAEKEEQISSRHAERAAGGADADTQLNLGFENARDGHHWQIGSYNWRTLVMTDPRVIWKTSDGSTFWVVADRADRADGQWMFYNLVESKIEPGARQPTRVLTTNALAFPNLTETPEEFRREIRFNKHLNVRADQSVEIPIADIEDYLKLHPRLSAKNGWWLRTQLQDRLAKPWTCLVVVLIAIPFGAASGRRNIFVGVAGSIVICFAYFVLLKLGLALGSGGYLPAWLAAWLPNLLFGITGLCLMNRVR